MTFEPSDAIEVKPAEGKGLGVFARRAIRKGEAFERAPVLVMSAEEYARGMDKSLLAGYVFAWGDNQIALVLGYGSLYNHSYKPNAKYEDEEPNTKQFVAVRDIKAGEEITVNYNGSPTGRAKMWFDVAQEARAAKGPRARKKAEPDG